MRVIGRPPRGGRGLKLQRTAQIRKSTVSPSSRRAWIEIMTADGRALGVEVALLAEGVD